MAIRVDFRAVAMLLEAQKKLLGEAMALDPPGGRNRSPAIQNFPINTVEGRRIQESLFRARQGREDRAEKFSPRPRLLRDQMYQEHMEGCAEDGTHPDGCFYCGGDHPSDCCISEERGIFWNLGDEDDERY
jgi:hypothetical protein